ncbi:hypothetical protein VMCG_03669 [Cytospora schulzeri]|uniref:Uncharacterized protein n=1 Tax=Cytospora schulzeri TaxID=448051 RepID=A0A423WWJ8_9PEZI|nr:hypothetical protein VMCG_03669 [Valsa malicola]
MSMNNNIDKFPGASQEASPEQMPNPTFEDVSRVLRLLDLPELRLDSFNDEESLKILIAIQKCSGDNDDEFKNFLALPKLICQAHHATETAEKDLFDRLAELEEAEDKANAFPEELDYDDDDNDDYGSYETRGEDLKQELPRLDNLTLAMREAHARAAEGREERADLALEYLETWLKILAPTSVGDVVHEKFHGAEDTHMAREDALVEAYWLLDAHPRYEENWGDELVWDFIRDGRTALDLLISRGAIILGDTDSVKE